MTNPHDPMIDTNDPRLTAYVLGELAPDDVAQIETALKSSPELRAAVADIRQATETLAKVFLTEPPLQLTPEQKSKLLVEAESATNTDVHLVRAAANTTPTVAGDYYRPSSASPTRWLPIAIAAGLASLLIGGAFYLSGKPGDWVAKTDGVASEPELMDFAVKDEPIAESSNSEMEQPFDQEEVADLAVAKEAFSPARAAKPPANTLNQRSHNSPSKSYNKSDSEIDSAVADSAMPSYEDKALAGDRKMPFGSATKLKSTPLPVEPKLAAQPKIPLGKKGFPQAEKLAEAKPPLEPNFDSNSATTLALAQQSLDQSSLGSANLRVVAQAPSGGFGAREGFGAGGGLGVQAEPTPPGENTWEDHKSVPISPTIFKLQISDQDAKRMVQLLASYADPKQQRKLSFDDLISFQPSPLVANNNENDDFQPNDSYGDGNSNFGAKLESDDYAEATAPSPQQATAAALAMKLREFVAQPKANLAFSKPSANTRGVVSGPDALPSVVGQTPANSKASKGGIANSPAYSGSTQQGAVPLGDDDQKPADGQQRLRDLNLDYSQVVQQLKLNLEIRNRSLK